MESRNNPPPLPPGDSNADQALPVRPLAVDRAVCGRRSRGCCVADGAVVSGFTPGPWEYGVADGYCGFYIAPRGTLPTLASVERPRGSNETLNVTAFNFPGSTEANARLIAAAPDGFDAAELTYIALLRQPHDAWRIENQNLLCALRDYIAKATGQDSQTVQEHYEAIARATGESK